MKVLNVATFRPDDLSVGSRKGVFFSEQYVHTVFRFRIIWPGPLQETWIRIRVAKKIAINSNKNQPKLQEYNV